MAGHTQHEAGAVGDQIRTTFSVAMRVKSAVLAIVAIGIGLLCWLVLNMLQGIADDHEVALSSFVAWWIGHAPLIVLLALPAVAVSIAGAVLRRGALGWMLLSLLCALIPVTVVLYCFISVVGPMYNYQSL